MARTRTQFVMMAGSLAALLAVSGCAKKPPVDGEVRLPAGSIQSSDAAGANGGAAWSPQDGPALQANGNGTSSNPFGLDSGSGGMSENGNLSGVESAQQIADLDMVHFSYDQSAIAPEWQKVLDHHADWLTQHKSLNVQIEGHCDERGTEEYNVSLGQKRADAVREYLVGKGVEGARLTTISYGKLRPLTFDQTEDAHSLNRRAMFLVYTPGVETAAAQ